VSRLGLGEGLMRVARCICIGNQRCEHVLREVTRGLPQILLFCRQPEIDGHCCSSLKRWSAGSAQVPRRPKLLLPVCFRAPQLLWCPPISDRQLAIAAQSLAGLRRAASPGHCFHREIQSRRDGDAAHLVQNLATRKLVVPVQIHPWSYLTSCSKANSVPGSRQTATPGSPSAAKPRVGVLGNVVVTSVSPTLAGRDAMACRL